MDQAAAQPARASSAAPAHPIAAVPPHASTAAPAHPGTVAHTAQPAGFWTETLRPAVFWNASSATATALAVIAAFVVPKLAERRQQKARRRYAVQMLPPVFEEAVRLADEANRVYRICLRVMEKIGTEPDAATKELHEQNRFRHFPGELEYDFRTGRATIGSMAVEGIQKLGAMELPAYSDNRPWLADLYPEEAGLIQNAFTDAKRCLRELSTTVHSWPVLLAQVDVEQVRALLDPLFCIVAVMRPAARVLGHVIDEKVPEVWDADGPRFTFRGR
ncbi:hypothetical protein [Dyella sp. 2RAB6]|uniref:hypothetical protein n=1 Tax=Dyella sp. 2RAB6 TaxID=3232992 RepID=UPI003F8ECA50